MLLLIVVIIVCATHVSGKKIACNELSDVVLSDILGPAFNSRYMSIDQPVDEEDNQATDGRKRKAGAVPSFYVDDQYARELGEQPAWLRRRKRSTMRQWECESKVGWIDLGIDYFPRYLRSVECTTKVCWYGHYKCKPRSFTVKLLRRKRGRCSMAKKAGGVAGAKVGDAGLPSDLRELWVWEERAVNFCCDCAL